MKAAIRKHGIRISRYFFCLAVFLIAVLTGGETARLAPFAIALLLLLSAGLLFLRDTRYLTLPFLELCLLFIFCYDSFDVFIRYAPFLPIPLVALAVHIIRLRPRFAVGPTLPALAAVAVATMLGGIGMIPVADYLRPAALGYTVGLGPGLVATYLILKNTQRSALDRDMLADDLLCWGLTAAAIVFWYNVPLFLQNGVAQLFSGPQWSNNIATMLMIAMPAAFIARERRLYRYALAFLMFAACMLAGSRGGQLFVGVELVVCCLWAWRTEEHPVRRLWSRLFFLYALLLVGYLAYVLLLNLRALGFLNPGEARWPLLARGFEDFLQNPLFGSGLGYRGNADLYSGKKGTINWYHMSVAQIVGGLGLCGSFAWAYQLAARCRVAARAWRDRSFGFLLCYLGLFLMSLVNPGEFCPVPYAFLAVLFFVAIENALTEQEKLPPTAPWLWRYIKTKMRKK